MNNLKPNDMFVSLGNRCYDIFRAYIKCCNKTQRSIPIYGKDLEFIMFNINSMDPKYFISICNLIEYETFQLREPIAYNIVSAIYRSSTISQLNRLTKAGASLLKLNAITPCTSCDMLYLYMSECSNICMKEMCLIMELFDYMDKIVSSNHSHIVSNIKPIRVGGGIMGVVNIVDKIESSIMDI